MKLTSADLPVVPAPAVPRTATPRLWRSLQRHWGAWCLARRHAREAERHWAQTLQDAQHMAALARAMTATAQAQR